MIRRCVVVLACALLTVGAVSSEERPTTQIGPEVGAPVTPFLFEGDLREVAEERTWQPGDPIKHIPKRVYFADNPPPQQPRGYGMDPLALQQFQRAEDDEWNGVAGGDPQFTTPETNFLAQSFNGIGVPDTVGDVGPNHIIHGINGTPIRIWDKATPQPNVLTTFELSTLASGGCANGGGDPVVLYDRQADRWMLSEFGSGNRLCVYISQTPDPVAGGWFNYEFVLPSFPDYPKYGVWPTDANGGDGSYVVTANDGGPGVIVLDRGQMLQGLAAGFQRFATGPLPGFGFQAITPADIDGPLTPPSGAPAIIMRHRDTEVHGGAAAGDLLEMWEFDADWQTPANSTFSAAPSIDVSEFDSDLCGTFSFNCFSQPDTGATLDPIREAIMNRLQYMHHDDGIETLVGNLVTDVTGSDDGGVRWFELRRSGGGAWQLYQEGTYAVDSDSRWMAGSSMDSSKNIALAYNVSSTTTYPGLRYTGRLAGDPLGLMTQPETSIAEGVASQPFNRFGDYAAMGLDPVDDCTFWFTGEAVGNGGNWFTQWASFRFEACGCLLAPTPPALSGADLGDNKVAISWDDSDLATVVDYTIQRSRTPGGPYETIATVTDTSPGVAGGAGYDFEDDTVSGGTTYYYVVVAADGGACSSAVTNELSVDATGRCLFEPLFAGLQTIGTPFGPVCGIELGWTAAISECAGGIVYNIYRSSTPGFVPGPASLIASGVTGTSVVDIDGLPQGAPRYYVVRALDAVSLVEDDNVVERTASANSEVQTLMDEVFETAGDFAAWTVSTGPGAHVCGTFIRDDDNMTKPDGGNGFYALALNDGCGLLPRTSTKLDSPSLDTSAGNLQSVELSFDLFYSQGNGANATVEAFDGSAWQVVWSDTNATIDQRLTLDVSAQALGNSDFRVRFNYQNAVSDKWYSVDNVLVTAVALTPCTTAQSPPPIPDGSAGTTALTGRRIDAAGSSVDVTWDALSCSSTANNLLYGSLASVSDTQLSGSVCGIGTTGSFGWSGVPAGDLFFLIVGTDGAAVEGSWGKGFLGERSGLNASGECGTTLKATSSVCP